MRNDHIKSSPQADIQGLMDKPVWQMSGKEFCMLTQYATDNASSKPSAATAKTRVIGIKDLASYLGCCESTIYTIKRLGILDPAIVSQIGKRIVFDAERARELADQFQKSQREQRDSL